MTRAIFYIQLGAKEEIGFGHPFGQLAGWQVYDLDNHSDAVTLQYARRLLDQAGEVVVVFNQVGSCQGLGALTAFLEAIIRNKEKKITAYSTGVVDLPVLLKKKLLPEVVVKEKLAGLLSGN
jgi:hypothetical protein